MATTRSIARRLIAEGHDPTSPDFLPRLRMETTKAQETANAAPATPDTSKVG